MATLVRDLHTTVEIIQGITAAYALTMVCLMLLSAKASELGEEEPFLPRFHLRRGRLLLHC
jgi:hypothetical protein